MRHSHRMRTLALLLLLPTWALAEAPLTAKDQAEIRTVIEEQAKQENQKPSSEIWSERGPIVYRIGAIVPVAADVATAEADGVRTGTYGQRGRYLFILTRSTGHWTVAKKVQVCDGAGFKLICESPRFGAHGSSGCPG